MKGKFGVWGVFALFALCLLVTSAFFTDVAGAADASKVLRVPIDGEPDSFNVAYCRNVFDKFGCAHDFF